MTQLEQAQQWLKAMRIALDNQDRSRVLQLDDINRESGIDWDLMPESIANEYDKIVADYCYFLEL